MLNEKGIDRVGTRTTIEASNVRQATENVPKREYTAKEWKKIEKQATSKRKIKLSKYKQKLSKKMKNNFGKEVVFLIYM